MSDVRFRHATADDVAAIARLHTRSWRENYRGVYSDVFLDGEALGDRLAVWGGRLAGSEPGRFTIVAESSGAAVGFAYTILDEDPVLGAVLQNLHVTTIMQRQGIGSGLMAEVARTVVDRRPASGLHVWVRDQNGPAKAFYEALGGTPAGRKLGGPFADGGRAPVLCFAWPMTNAILTDKGYKKLLASAPGHVKTVRDLVIDAISPAQLQQLREASERIVERIDGPISSGTTRE